MVWSDLYDEMYDRYSPSLAKPRPIEPRIFIPQYQAQTPQKQGRLEDKFLQFTNHVSLKAEQDYLVKVSEEDGITYLRLVQPIAYLKESSTSVSNTGKNGTTANISWTHKINMQKRPSFIDFSHDLEVIINGDKFILEKYHRASL